MIVFDTARADAFEPYGAPRGASPTVRQLAERGRAHQAFSAAPWTIPSHGAMFSGTLPGSAALPGPDPERMARETKVALGQLEDRWLPSILAKSGYRTGGLSANGLVSSQCGFEMGFDEFHYIHSARWCHVKTHTLYGRAVWAYRTLKSRVDDGSHLAEKMLGEWIADRERRPFFWFVNLIECHSPYLPPLPFNPLTFRQRLRAGREADLYLMAGAQWRATLGGLDVPDEPLLRMRQLYAASVRLVDAWVARLLDSLDKHGLLDETIVVVTSDHGENIGENGLMGHAFSLADRLIRVPLVTAGPIAERPGRMVSLVDLPGWLATSCGIDDHRWEPPAERSVAVAQFEAPGQPDDPRVPAIIKAWGLGDDAARRGLTETLACATNGRRKLLDRAGTRELYDLELDPLERAPVAPGPEREIRYGDELAVLGAALDEAERERAERPVLVHRNDLDSAEMAELEERMKMLGYI